MMIFYKRKSYLVHRFISVYSITISSKYDIIRILSKCVLFFQTIDDENLKQLNDEQLFRLLEEAYHSKKLDEKNKSAIFKVMIFS